MVYLKLPLLIVVLYWVTGPAMASSHHNGWPKGGSGSQIQESACSIHNDDVWQFFSHDDIAHTSSLDEQGVYPLNIRLINCRFDKYNTSQWQGMRISLDGKRMEDDIHLFAMNGGEHCLGMQIQDDVGHEVIPGMLLSSHSFGDNLMELHYKMRLVHQNEMSQCNDWQGAIRLMITYL